MKVVGIIAEYNPFHNGHKYHIDMAKKITGSDYCVCIMSGSFTQPGNIACLDKFKRAKIAINNGCDLVIELPTVYVNTSAENFAFGSINILDKLNIIDTLCFGSESDNISSIYDISSKILKNEKKIWNITKKCLDEGISFSGARVKALSTFLNSNEMDIISNSNDILGLEYVNTINRLKSNIKAYSIKRSSSNFNETTLNSSNVFTSATSIREFLNSSANLNEKSSKLSKFIPEDSLNLLLNENLITNDNMFNIIKYKIITENKEIISNINEINEGLENKIINEINTSKNYNEFVNNIKSKRYKLSKIKRMLNNLILDLSKNDFNYAKENKIGYAHILAVSPKGKELLSKLTRISSIPVITSINDNILKNLDNNICYYLKKDILATDIHSIISNQNIKKDYTNRL